MWLELSIIPSIIPHVFSSFLFFYLSFFPFPRSPPLHPPPHSFKYPRSEFSRKLIPLDRFDSRDTFSIDDGKLCKRIDSISFKNVHVPTRFFQQRVTRAVIISIFVQRSGFVSVTTWAFVRSAERRYVLFEIFTNPYTYPLISTNHLNARSDPFPLVRERFIIENFLTAQQYDRVHRRYPYRRAAAHLLVLFLLHFSLSLSARKSTKMIDHVTRSILLRTTSNTFRTIQVDSLNIRNNSVIEHYLHFLTFTIKCC